MFDDSETRLGLDFWEVDRKRCFYLILRVLIAEVGTTPINLPPLAQARSIFDESYPEGQNNEELSAKGCHMLQLSSATLASKVTCVTEVRMLTCDYFLFSEE